MLQLGMVISVLIVVAAIIIGLHYLLGNNRCDTAVHVYEDGTVRANPSGRWFPDMNAFHQWAARDQQGCPLPIMSGSSKRGSGEQTYAHTPIYKVDDYEFSRSFGYERGGRMEVPRQDFNKILNQRSFDWADKPISSDERRAKSKEEGFTDADDVVKEEIQRYGEIIKEAECRTREDRQVAALVARAYASDPDYEPVLTKVGPHSWEVNELKPLNPNITVDEENKRIVDTANDAVDIAFTYRQAEDAIDPYFPERLSPSPSADQYIPGMQRMFGPTFDHVRWY